MALAETRPGTRTMYRADHVGSPLRPPELLQARADHQAGQLAEDQLHSMEDEAVLKALALQNEAGIDIFTDGEYRRTAWSSALPDVAEGLAQNTQSPTQRLLGQWQGPHGELATARLSVLPPMVAKKRLEHARGRGVTVAMHMCRGNNRSAWHAEGSYEPIAEKAFEQLEVDRFLLEYDTDRAGGFEPLRFIPHDKTVVLGLISSKEPELESIDGLRRRVDEAARYVPLERLAISPQCGFASTMLGNLLTRDEHRRKLELVVETARTIWGI